MKSRYDAGMSLDLADDKWTWQQAIAWAKVDPASCRQMASQGHSALTNGHNSNLAALNEETVVRHQCANWKLSSR